MASSTRNAISISLSAALNAPIASPYYGVFWIGWAPAAAIDSVFLILLAASAARRAVDRNATARCHRST
jgi:hypothetical protein